MKAQELIVEIKPKFVVDDETAAMALKLVEWYVNDNGKKIYAVDNADGTVSYRFGEKYEMLCGW